MAKKRIELEHARDFTGGLNLQSDPYSLAPNETFDLANVDIDRRGGFGIRRGMRPWSAADTGFAGAPSTHCTYVDPSNVRHALIGYDGGVKRYDGAAWVDVKVSPGPGSSDISFAQMDGALYFTNLAGAGGVQKWSGAGLSTSIPGVGFHDDLAAPTGNTFPQSAFLAVHNNSMWSAWGERVRWSHPGSAEDWRTNDWIDVDPGNEGSWVRALVPFGNSLLVFKKKGLYAIHGAPPDGLSMVKISDQVGVERPSAVASTEEAVFFWDARSGLWKFDGQSLEYVFERVYPLLEDGKIDNLWSQVARVAYHRRRIYIAARWKGEPWDGDFVVLVYALDVGRNGAWSIHDTPARSFHVHTQSLGSDAQLLGAFGTHVYEYDVENLYEDEITPGTTVPIAAHYTTRWFDAKNPALRKRWKRPIIVARGEQNTTMFVDVFTDYNPTRVTKTFELTTELSEEDMVWDVDNWDEAAWAGEIGDRSTILRGSQLGTGTAKALRFKNGTDEVFKGQNWRVHGVTMKWISKRLRA